jgi:carboxyl-terminal processing protease
LLIEAVRIANLFVPKGQEIVSTRGKVKQWDKVYTATENPVDTIMPIAVLVNRGSASASEIVAGAIQDLDRGMIIGTRTFGKGLVQTTRDLSYNAKLKITTAKYYIPSGRCIQARDFSHPNEDGSVGMIPDSLISEFKTKNGRKVKDGGGIAPDVEIIPEPLSQIATELYLRNFIFDFATDYYWAHQQIKSIDQFTFSDKDYADFKAFLLKRNFSYKTVTEESFNELIDNAKKEKYYDMHKDLFTALEKDLTHDLDQDLTLFRSEITELIEDEIISRFFYESAAISWTLKNDEQVLKALEILNNRMTYNSILNGKTSPALITRENENVRTKQVLQVNSKYNEPV